MPRRKLMTIAAMATPVAVSEQHDCDSHGGSRDLLKHTRVGAVARILQRRRPSAKATALAHPSTNSSRAGVTVRHWDAKKGRDHDHRKNQRRLLRDPLREMRVDDEERVPRDRSDDAPLQGYLPKMRRPRGIQARRDRLVWSAPRAIDELTRRPPKKSPPLAVLISVRFGGRGPRRRTIVRLPSHKVRKLP